MRKKLLFLVLCALVVCVVTVSVVFADDADTAATESDGEVPTELYTLQVGDATMIVDPTNLNLSITKDGRTWYSGLRHTDSEGSVDDGLNTVNGNQITDGITVTYRNKSSNNVTTRGISSITDEPISRFTKRDDGFDARVRLSGNVGISFNVQVRFDGTTLKVTIPSDSINETSENIRLEQLSVYPYFDSSYMQEQDGQIFIPDGSGALIDLSRPSNARQNFSRRVYGEDFGLSAPTSRANEPERITMPVVATMYPQGGTVTIVTGGAEYSRVTARVGGLGTNPYNATNFSFIYREEYNHYYESTGTEGKSYQDFQEEINNFDAQLTYTLLPKDANIADVAKIYRDTLDIRQTVIQNVGMRLQFLMAENKSGMFGREKVQMSTPEFVESVAKDVAYYCNNLTVSLTGYQRGGLGGADPSVFPMATKSAYRTLTENLAKIDVTVKFTVDYVRVHDRASISDSNLLQNISEQFVTMADTRVGSDVKFRLIKPSYSQQLLHSDAVKLADFNAGIEATNLGALLFSGYKQEAFTRTQLMNQNAQAVRDAGVPMALSNPNDYMFGVIDSYVDTPIEYSAYLIETESVPFLQMVLAGSMPMYSEALNLDYTGTPLILKLIDSNVYPSFLLTEKDAIELYRTDSQGIFTSSFDVWKYSVRSTYEQVNAVLNSVVGQQIVRRDKLAENVYVNTYSNGVGVVVNYSNNPITYRGTSVEAMSAAAVR